MDYPGVAVVTRWMEGIAAQAPQSASDSTITFPIISPSGIGTIQREGGWIDVRAHKTLCLIAKASDSGCTIRIETKRTTTDDVVGVLVPNLVLAADTTTEVYNSDISIGYFRVITTAGTSPNTVALSFLVK